jgi:uncharacterized protein YjbI with pentapeptide repeats
MTQRRTGEATRARTARPVFPDRKHLVRIDPEDLDDEPHIRGALLVDTSISGSRLANGRIDESIFEGVVLHAADASSLIVRSAGFFRSDLSLASLAGASFSTCVLDGCKLTGVRLNRAVLKDVSLNECRTDFAQFQYAKLQRVRFERCNLKHAYFNGATMRKTVFEGCDLTGADFSGADISGSDLRRSRIEDIRLAPDQLRGVIVTHDQAIYLAGLLGLVIRDD